MKVIAAKIENRLQTVALQSRETTSDDDFSWLGDYAEFGNVSVMSAPFVWGITDFLS